MFFSEAAARGCARDNNIFFDPPGAFAEHSVEMSTDYDGAWKEALEFYLHPFLEIAFPDISARIEWSAGVEFLDKELQEIVRDSELGKQRVDKLAKLRRLDGGDEWVLLHAEIQSQPDPGLPLRLYQYHHRIADRYQHPVVTLAFLADEDPAWRPTHYESETWGCRVRFDFLVAKLLNLGTVESLAAGGNPAGIVMAAHLAAQQTRRDDAGRFGRKKELVRQLYERGFSRKDILELFRLIDWLLVLPEPFELAFRQDVEDYEKEKAMPYITSIERIGRQEGRQEAQRGAVIEALELRFARVPEGLREEIGSITDPSKLQALFRAAIRCPDIEAFAQEL